jgi:hypothetical protein
MRYDDAADDPVRSFVLGLPRYPADWTPEQRAEYNRRLKAFNAAREAEDEPEPVAA